MTDSHAIPAGGQSLPWSGSTAFERALDSAIQAARWKHRQATDTGPEATQDGLTIATGIEIERRCRAFETPVAISVCNGTVTPSASAQMTQTEAPAIRNGHVSPPPWTTTPVEQSWLEVSAAGTSQEFLIDPSVPPQVTGAPEDAALNRAHVSEITAPAARPSAYKTADTNSQPLSEATTDVVQWGPEMVTWPFTTPAPVSSVPADGGAEMTVTANTVVKVSARDGLAHLPSNSVDVVITSPPYRLQRQYPDTETVWGGDPDCTHQWETESLYTDTPIRATGGAGFNSSDDPDELRRERWRDSSTCVHCGAWAGQLGLEPTATEYVTHLVEIFTQLQRVMKPAGSLWVTIADSYSDGHRQDSGDYRDAPRKSLVGVPPQFELAMRQAGWITRERCIWTKPSPTPDPAHDRRTPAYEHVYRFVQSEEYLDATDQSATTVLDFDTATGPRDQTAPMPKSLAESLLDTTVPPDMSAVVLDPFAGSGTTLQAAAENGDAYLGFELSSDTADTARNRLAAFDHDTHTLSGQTPLSLFTRTEQSRKE